MSNRAIYLEALRSGEYHKGTIHTDENGRPLIEFPTDRGFCAVGLIDTLFNPEFTSAGRRDALDITQAQVTKIQRQWNDSDLTFPQIADLIEWEMFHD